MVGKRESGLLVVVSAISQYLSILQSFRSPSRDTSRHRIALRHTLDQYVWCSSTVSPDRTAIPRYCSTGTIALPHSITMHRCLFGKFVCIGVYPLSRVMCLHRFSYLPCILECMSIDFDSCRCRHACKTVSATCDAAAEERRCTKRVCCSR